MKEELGGLKKLGDVIVVGECADLASVDAELAASFDATETVEELAEEDRAAALRWLCRKEGKVN